MTTENTSSSRPVKNMASSLPVQILDGGMSRELIRLNAPFKQPEWSAQALIEAPNMVLQVHREFAEAGADVLTTNSYALVPFHIGETRFWKQAEELAALAGQVARTAADEVQSATGRKVLVAGSLPPIFGSYRPDLFQQDEVSKHLELLVRGLSPYVDIWLGETLSLIAEAEAVVAAVKGHNKPIWISFNLADGEEDEGQNPAHVRIRSGETVAEASRRVMNLGVDALLFNCNQPELMAPAVRDTKEVLNVLAQRIPLGVYANAFEPLGNEHAANESVASIRTDLQSPVYTTIARQWVDSGATIIGGCCGIGVEHIRELSRQLKDGSQKH